ncbi:MAG: response regulator [Deltaproteobacteria bacterium]|nr:response regulator [Deltaproteobacteria bacterium]
MTQTDRVVLVVDDNPDNLDFMERTFRNHYRTVRAQDGDEAIELLKKQAVDVIITDQRMPRVSGTELLRRSLAIHPSAVKIILSAYTDTTEILSAINVCRVNHYLVKPVTGARLLEVVERALALVPAAKRFE